MSWREYFFAFLTFNTIGMLFLFFLFRWQHFFDPTIANWPSDTAFNAAISFVTNTNWQSYVPETDISWIVQTLGITTQQFLSAAGGLCLFSALARAFRNEGMQFLGNFWQDLVRGSFFLLLPLALIFAPILIITGVPQSFGHASYTTLDQSHIRKVHLGMCASQVAIKQLGTNGGGSFAANSAHPLENPSPLSTLLELGAILLIPMALCRTFGEMVGVQRQGKLFFFVMVTLFVLFTALLLAAELQENPTIPAHSVSMFQATGNMEGKECRIGPFWSALWAASTTATSNGSVCCCHSSLLPLAGAVSVIFMQLGEVVFGGIGTGMITAIAFLLIAIFSAGLMVGRTPEYLGKKIEVDEMRLVILIAIFPAALALLSTAAAVGWAAGRASLSSTNAHGFTEALYAFCSAAANNGSAFQGLGSNTPFYNIVTGLVIYLCRFFPAGMTLALAHLLSKKRKIASSAGTLPTDTIAFGLWFGFVIIILGALNFLPAITLGPLVEHMSLFFPLQT
jgi:K+-transporting ATPase ATPase A chain